MDSSHTESGVSGQDDVAMPGNPREHALDREAVNFIRMQLPAEWHSEEVVHDYGRDLIYEIVLDGMETGLEFRVQSKGHEAVDVVFGDRVAQPLRIATLNYYDHSMLPVMLVAYDATEKLAYFEWTQKVISQKLDVDEPDWRKRAGKSTVTLHIPLESILSDDASQKIVEYVESWRALHGLAGGLPPDRLRSYLKYKSRLLRFDFQTVQPAIAEHVERAGLCAKVAGNLRDRAVVLHGSAGYGKTWGAWEAASTFDCPVAWYEIRSSDSSSLRFVEGLAVSLLQAGLSAGEQTLGYINERSDVVVAEEALALLLEELEALETHVVLVIEQCEDASEDVVALVSALVEQPSKHIHQILTAKEIPAGIRQLVTRGSVAVVGEADLRWSEGETESYFNDVLGLGISAEVCSELCDRTEGWPAALAMAGRLLADANVSPDSICAEVTGHTGAVYEYFAENVYRSLLPETSALLKRLSLLGEFDAETVDHITGDHDGGARLQALRQETSFLSSSEGTALHCRIHRLFGEYLQQRFLEEEGLAEVKAESQSLAQHLLERGSWIAAIELSVKAEDEETTLEALEHVAPLLIVSGMGGFLLDILATVPETWISKSSPVLLARARAAGAHLPVNVALALCTLAVAAVAEQADPLDTELLRVLELELRLKGRIISDRDFRMGLTAVTERLRAIGDDFVADQTDLRRIELDRVDVLSDLSGMDKLIDEAHMIVERAGTETLPEQLVRGRALGLLATLISQKTWCKFVNSTMILRIKQSIGFDENLEARIELAGSVISGLAETERLYVEALTLLGDTDELAWAHMAIAWIHDRVDVMASVLVGLATSSDTSKDGPTATVHGEGVEALRSVLPFAERCEAILLRLRGHEGLVSLYVELARLHALAGNDDERIRFAQKARAIAEQYGYTGKADLARGLENGDLVPDFLTEHTEDEWDERFAESSDTKLDEFTEAMLEGFQGIAKREEIEVAVANDVMDMRDSAKVRGQWCGHVYVIQDLTHTLSAETIYREIPNRKIVCVQTDKKLDIGKVPFLRRWETFRGYNCLGCGYRLPRPSRTLWTPEM